MEKGRVSASDVNRLLVRLGIDPQEAKFLRTLNLSYKHLTDEEIYILTICADSARVLDTLKLSSNNIGDEGAIAISKFLLRNRTITCLDMGFNSIGDQGVAALSESLTVNNSLQTLYLSGNKISVTGFENLAKALASNTSLRFVYLTGNDAKAAGAEALASAITSSFSLETLDLGRNEIGPDGMASLTRSLKRCGPECRLKKLNISNNNLGDLGVIALGDAMSSYRNIVHLDVSFNNISQSGAVSLMAALRGYKALRSLFLDNNLIGDRGAKALAQSLSSMNISSLNIGFNNISAEGLSYILVDIFNAKCISSLALSGNILSPEVVKRISAYIRNDTMLRELYLDQMKMDRDSEKNIALGISLNENLVLSVFTGFALGPVLGELRNNETLISLSNDQVLKFLCQTRIEVKDTDPGMSQNQSCSNFLAAVAHVLPPENFKDNGTLSGFPSTNSFILSEEEISLLLSDADPFANSVRTNVTSVNSKNDATPIHIEDASLWVHFFKKSMSYLTTY